MAFDKLTHLPAALGGGPSMARPLSPGRYLDPMPSAPSSSCGGGCAAGATSPSPAPLRGAGGRTVQVCPPRDFDFTNLDDAGELVVLVAERIDCAAFRTADLIVRVHTDASIAGECSITIEVVSDGYTRDDPNRAIFGPVLGTGIVFDGAAPPEAGDVVVQTYSSGLGAMLAVRVVGQQADPAGEEVRARLSIDLALREC